MQMGPIESAPDESGEHAQDIERRLETLAEEIGALIDSGPVHEREALQDYAVSLIREHVSLPAQWDGLLPGSVEDAADEARLAPTRPSTSGVTLIGYGFLLLPIVLVLAPVLPPIGFMVAMTSICMVGAGVVLALASRVRSAFRGAPRS